MEIHRKQIQIRSAFHNRRENLEWTTFAGNDLHAHQTGLNKGMKGKRRSDTKSAWYHQYRKLEISCLFPNPLVLNGPKPLLARLGVHGGMRLQLNLSK